MSYQWKLGERRDWTCLFCGTRKNCAVIHIDPLVLMCDECRKSCEEVATAVPPNQSPW